LHGSFEVLIVGCKTVVLIKILLDQQFSRKFRYWEQMCEATSQEVCDIQSLLISSKFFSLSRRVLYNSSCSVNSCLKPKLC